VGEAIRVSVFDDDELDDYLADEAQHAEGDDEGGEHQREPPDRNR
jgi:hypothetical protein